MQIYDCESFGTGPIGTLNDGCNNDTFEIIGVSVISVIILGVFVKFGIKRKTIGLTVLAGTSFYHVLYGEGNLQIAEIEGTKHGIERGLTLALLNSREITLPLTVTCVAFILKPKLTSFGQFLLWAYVLLTYIMAFAAHIQDEEPISYVFLGYDLLGVFLAIGLSFLTSEEVKYSSVKT